MEWKVRGIRGATTVSENTKEAITESVTELLNAIETRNQLNLEDIVSVTFTATPDLNAIFPAAIARQRPQWEDVPLLDVQQMQVEGSLKRCIRVLIHVNTPKPQKEIYHPYLRDACNLRPDWSLTHTSSSRSSHR
ncbi:chorismate mutase [Crocosphaera sp. UHCC 0190]|uniref:chorismate mutase n=1 Tax=Crocosphaera sp. UHCC 0190 TaxID=3110246 RepID=UPI002B1F6E55|nr:chorismate mutase [Crocosphaera sp. UHCC 0190]MEA5510009.1 chorismate mutase [Crocosphaera sp. UHCC 0190]